MRIPREPFDLTAGWLTMALRYSGAIAPDVAIGRLSHEEIGEERGFTGRIIRVTIEDWSAAEPPIPRTLIAKLPLAARSPTGDSVAPASSVVTSAAHVSRSAREVRFYLEMAPRSGIATPVCYFAGHDPASDGIVLLLEDLSHHRFGDVMAGCSPPDAALVMGGIARLHASWWQRPLPMPWLAGWTGDHEDAQVRLQRNLARLPAQVLATFPDDIQRLLHWLTGGAYRRVLDTLAAAPRTLIHGDLHLDNIAFRDDHAATLPIVTDWQTAGVGPAVVDVATFLSGAIGPTDDETVETDVLTSYHDTLLTARVTGYGRNALERDYGLALVRQLAGVFGWLANTELADLDGRERDVTLAAIGDGRLIAALRRRDPMALLA